VNPCLEAALHVHRGGRRVDPPRSHKDQHGERPKKRHSDEKPSNEGSESAFPIRGVRGYLWIFNQGYVWIFNHTSE
jgi:hypothetical protein